MDVFTASLRHRRQPDTSTPKPKKSILRLQVFYHLKVKAGDRVETHRLAQQAHLAHTQILRDLGVRKMRLLSMPMRFNAISGFDLEVVEYLPCE